MRIPVFGVQKALGSSCAVKERPSVNSTGGRRRSSFRFNRRRGSGSWSMLVHKALAYGHSSPFRKIFSTLCLSSVNHSVKALGVVSPSLIALTVAERPALDSMVSTVWYWMTSPTCRSSMRATTLRTEYMPRLHSRSTSKRPVFGKFLSSLMCCRANFLTSFSCVVIGSSRSTKSFGRSFISRGSIAPNFASSMRSVSMASMAWPLTNSSFWFALRPEQLVVDSASLSRTDWM
mmetsp:Transcript_96595/g.201869  ORF Transcript_96595/g.201869 Transcript_96595/m.201869 type:complete len:233 (+) Transcript_96595:1247-1945(+)